MRELLTIYSTPEKHDKSGARIIELRGKINKYFNEQIRKVG